MHVTLHYIWTAEKAGEDLNNWLFSYTYAGLTWWVSTAGICNPIKQAHRLEGVSLINDDAMV